MKRIALDKGRLEAFSDGVIAVIITIMVLELRVPHGSDLTALRPVLPTFVAYVISFVNVGIYWNNRTAFTLLGLALFEVNGKESTIARGFGSNRKGIASIVAYVLAVFVAFVAPWLSDVLVISVALMWFVPDRRMERVLVKE